MALSSTSPDKIIAKITYVTRNRLEKGKRLPLFLDSTVNDITKDLEEKFEVPEADRGSHELFVFSHETALPDHLRLGECELPQDCHLELRPSAELRLKWQAEDRLNPCISVSVSADVPRDAHGTHGRSQPLDDKKDKGGFFRRKRRKSIAAPGHPAPSTEHKPAGRQRSSWFNRRPRRHSNENHGLQERPATAVFDCTLTEVMLLEPDPSVPVPRVVRTLCGRLSELGGFRTEGLFRIPGSLPQIQALRTSIDHNDYELKGVSDPHVLASLLKLWLRDMRSSLIPEDLYYACVEAAEDADKCEEVLGRVKAPEKGVLEYLLDFLKKVTSEENRVHTKMTPDNMAIVFAPTLLRCPSADPVMMLANAKKERNFLLHLLGGSAKTGPDEADYGEHALDDEGDEEGSSEYEDDFEVGLVPGVVI